MQTQNKRIRGGAPPVYRPNAGVQRIAAPPVYRPAMNPGPPRTIQRVIVAGDNRYHDRESLDAAFGAAVLKTMVWLLPEEFEDGPVDERINRALRDPRVIVFTQEHDGRFITRS